MRTHVRVMQKDIDQGARANGESCPVARAVARAANRSCHTSYYSIVLDGKRGGLPESVKQWIRTFDRGGSVKPFEFDIDLV